MVFTNSLSSYYEKFLATGEVKCIDEEIPFEIPNGWQWERIGNIFETTSGSTPLSRNPDYYKNGNINWVRTTDLNNGILNKTEIQITSKAIIDYNLSILPQTSVCVAMYGGAGTIGKHCILHFDTTINQSVCAIQPNGFCNMDYIHTFIEYQRPFWMDFAAGSRKDPNINQLIIKHCLLPIPPQEEQLRIVTKLNQLYPYIYQYGNSQNRLNQINKEIWHSLKKSILQEAIQGKLVSQIAEEGTAQELHEQIRQEKLQLVKEGKLKKSALTDSIIFRGDDNKYYEQVGNENIDITEEIPFDLPENWTWVRFGQYVRMSIGKTPPRGETKYWANGKYPWVSISDMSDYGLVTTTKESVSEYAKSLFGEISPVGTLIMSFKLTVGRTSLLNTSAYHNEAIISIYPFVDKNYQARNFLFHILPIISNLGDTKDAIKGKTLNSKSLNNLLLPLPPLNEQGRIVAMIELLFDKLK